MNRKNLSALISISLLLFVMACKPEKKVEAAFVEAPKEMDKTVLSTKEKQGKELLENCLNAHGGLQAWKSFEGIEYNLSDNGKQVYQITNLKDRRAYI